MYVCNTCGTALLPKDGSVVFPCPICGEKIARCWRCRSIGRKYVCKKCGFEGP